MDENFSTFYDRNNSNNQKKTISTISNKNNYKKNYSNNSIISKKNKDNLNKINKQEDIFKNYSELSKLLLSEFDENYLNILKKKLLIIYRNEKLDKDLKKTKLKQAYEHIKKKYNISGKISS